jgi:hypothetical protein
VSGTGPWTHYVNLDVGAYCVPTIRIELRLATELSRNRVGKAEPIIEWMMKNGGDLGLLQRAMQACGVPLERQDDFLTELRRSRRNHG